MRLIKRKTAMKKLLFISLLAFTLFLSCDKISKLTQFNLDYNETIEIPASSAIDIPVNINTPEIETNSEKSFKGNNTNKDNIESIKLSKMNLSIALPENGNFGFLKSITVYMIADGLEEIEIASKTDIPENIGNILELGTKENELKEYVLKDSFNLRINTVFDEIITTDHTIDLHTVLFVDANVLGL